MNIYRLHGDESGETRLTQIDLSKFENPAVGDTKVEGLLGIPATTVALASIVERQTDESIHAAPWRQFLVMLQGQHEIITTSGDRCLLEHAATCSSPTMSARRATTAGTAAKNTWSW